jgi:PAS domain S-box-containing protein
MSPASVTDELALAMAEQAPDAIVFADTEGTIRFWNPAAERVFGHAEADALGKSLDLIIPERFREAHWKGYERAVRERATKYVGRALATRASRSDGGRIYVELSFSVVLDAEGEVAGVLSHARDITERFEKEKAKRQRSGGTGS